MTIVRWAALSLLCLLALTTPASAECAWVLWYYQLNQATDLHAVDSAHVSKAECEKEALGYVPVLKKNGYTVTTGARVVLAEKGANKVKYYYLPDTVDPRGPAARGSGD